jgi:DnaJ-class molecular chaperone
MNNPGQAAYQKIRCPKCNGSGKEPYFVACNYFNGSGVYTRVTEAGFESGYQRHESEMTCPYCKGTKRDMFSPTHRPCSLCRRNRRGIRNSGSIAMPAVRRFRQGQCR